MKKNTNQLSLSLGDTKKKKLTWLSHTAIEMINRCQRCYWLKYNKKIYQPQGIVSRLANRFDIVLKNYFDGYRTQGILPLMIKGKIKGILQNPFQERYYHKVDADYGFYGKLDECIIEDNLYIPVDFKTTSSDPRGKEIMDAYQHQIDEYIFLMDVNHKKTAGFGYLIFFFPEFNNEVHNGFPMVIEIVKVEGHPENVEKRIQKAIDILKNQIPDSNPECEYCNWLLSVKKYY